MFIQKFIKRSPEENIASAEKKLRIFQALRDSGYQTQVNYFPAHMQPVFAKLGYKAEDFPNALEYYQREISLPMFADPTQLTDSRLEEISKIVISSLSR